MSNSPIVSPAEAQRLIHAGYTYVDVRSELEFAAGHPPGAFNVPISRVEGDRLVDNPDFDGVMSIAFRTVDPLIIGCHSGARSRAAVVRLRALGFSALVELEHGFNGARDAFGRRLPGWVQRGFAVELGEPLDRSYAVLHARLCEARATKGGSRPATGADRGGK